MSSIHSFALNPLSRVLALVAITPLLMVSPAAKALTTVAEGQELNIGPNSFDDSYQVNKDATLNSNGATTKQIQTATGATVNLTGTAITATGSGSAIGMAYIGSTGTIGGNTTIVSTGDGLSLSSDPAVAVGSSATVSDTTITAERRGLVLNSISSLSMQNTQVSGGTLGLNNFEGKVSAVDSSIVGGTNGMQWRSDLNSRSNDGFLDLDNSHLEGLTGSAITFVAAAGTTTIGQINVRNGSTVVGGNGVLLDVADRTTANMLVDDSHLVGEVLVNTGGVANLTLQNDASLSAGSSGLILNTAAGGTSTLLADNSHLVGDVFVDAGGTANVTLQNAATLTGRLDNVDSLAVNSDAKWILIGDSETKNLSLNGGTVRFGQPGDFFKLSLESLSGSGTFDMEANFAEGKVDFLNVSGTADGNHDLLIRSSGADPVDQTKLHVVHIGGGTAEFALLGGRVDLGTYSYNLVRRGDDWYLDTSKHDGGEDGGEGGGEDGGEGGGEDGGGDVIISPGTESVLALFNAAPTVWYGELTTLRTRMGELRLNEGTNAGVWMRAYGNKYNVSAGNGVGYRQNQQGLTIGADAPLPFGDGQWLIGLQPVPDALQQPGQHESVRQGRA